MIIRSHTADAAPQELFQPSSRLALYYERSLRKIARHVGDLTMMFDGNGDSNPQPLTRALNRYALVLRPWAEQAAWRMVDDTSRAVSRNWRIYSAQMGRELRREIEEADTGPAMRALLAEQVQLITSLPTEAAERVQKIATESLITGARFDQLRDEILRTGDVTASRATTIARTETSRASSVLTEVRARAVGSTGYIWRSHRDRRTRPSHRAMNGQFVAWDSPPTLDKLTGHAGCVPNCRCFAVPVLPE